MDRSINRSVFDYVVTNNNCLEGGTQEACIKVIEVLQNAINPGNKLHAPGSCVKIDEFIEAVKVLAAFAFRKDDEIPETWHCNINCKRGDDILCLGKCNVKMDSQRQCPYFMYEG